jgi:hypothetical protein
MGIPVRFEPTRDTPRALAAFASAALHLVIFIAIVFFGGRHDGGGVSDTRTMQMVMLEADEVDKTDGIELPPIDIEPAPAPALPEEQLHFEAEPPLPATGAESPELSTEEQQFADVDLPTQAPPAEVVVEPTELPATIAASPEELADLPERLARLAEQLKDSPRTQLEWQENGKQYSAELIRERAKDGTGLERVIAQVSASDRGKILATRIMLKRLSFSQFTQVVDRWDPMVQLHDDVIVGRFHSNSQFNVMNDSRVSPKFLGKVTTAARTFEMTSKSRKRQAEIFPGGVETRTSRIDLPVALQPSVWAPEDSEARIHEISDDTQIRFFPDGSYMWRSQGSQNAEYLNAPSEHPVYFIARPGTTLYVQGTVTGKVLIYSPQRIVIEDDLTYAHDPRRTPGSHDYLGLVSDKYIEVAPPSVTGPGDLAVHAAIFAGRRFVVRDIDHPRSATLRIFGSLSAGSISASEPRYATEIEYDDRFEQHRPPGFPLTSRYEAEHWDGHWVQSSERMTEEAF